MSRKTTWDPIKMGCIEAIHQCLQIIDSIDDATFCRRKDGFSSVGAQFRHVHDHFECFLRGLPARKVDYDQRKRDVTLESCRESMHAAMTKLIHEMEAIEIEPAGGELLVVQASGRNAPCEWLKSSVERELVFLSGHTIHHLAMIKLTLALQGIQCPEEIGVAWSTLKHLDDQESVAK